MMIWKPWSARALIALAMLGVTAAMLAVSGGPAAAAVSCPAVDSVTGAVSPAPGPAADLQGCNLTGANLFGADLTGANLAGADLTGANLTAARLSNADLTGATLASADLDGAFLDGATLTMVRSGGITGSPMALPANWVLATSPAGGYLAGPGADFSGQNLSETNFNPGPGTSVTDLAGADFAGATVRGFSGDNLTGANLTGANLRGANLYGSDLTRADFSNADLTGANLGITTLTGTGLGTATLTGIDAWGLTGTPASLPANWSLRDHCLIGPGAVLRASSLGEADLSGVDLAGADLTSAHLGGSDLTGANLAGADLSSADLTSANLTDANLTGATLTNASLSGVTWLHTICPDGSNSDGYVDGCLSPLDTTPPVATVTGVSATHHYIIGAPPTPGCHTTDNSTVATPASLTVTTTGTHGVGPFTATCAGAVDRAGNTQAAPVSVTYSVVYGFGGFLAPKSGATLAKSAHAIVVTFRFVRSSGQPIGPAVASALAAAGKVRASLAGPAITSKTATCTWNAASLYFRCSIGTPSGVKTGSGYKYSITALENVGTGLIKAPAIRKATDPETVHFR
jgi:uncharacterized protein YjbI with pentapeptide repeats